MTSIFESVSNQLSSLPHLIPSFVRKPNENDERIDDLENQIARLDRESKWCDVELDRRIKELTAEVDSLSARSIMTVRCARRTVCSQSCSCRLPR